MRRWRWAVRETDHKPHPAYPPAFEGVRGHLSFLSTSTLVWRDYVRSQIMRTSLKNSISDPLSKVRLNFRSISSHTPT